MFGIISITLRKKVLHLKFKVLRVPTKTARWHKILLLSYMVNMFRFFSSIKWKFFYDFCRTFGLALQHFLSDIHKKCPIVRQVRRISTPLFVVKYAYKTNNVTLSGKIVHIIHNSGCWCFSQIVGKVRLQIIIRLLARRLGGTYKSLVHFDFDIFLPENRLIVRYVQLVLLTRAQVH